MRERESNLEKLRKNVFFFFSRRIFALNDSNEEDRTIQGRVFIILRGYSIYDFWILHFRLAKGRKIQSLEDEKRKRRRGEEGSLFLRRGIKVAQVPWRLYHTYFYTEYFNNNNINICKGWPFPEEETGPCPERRNTVRTHESLYTFPVLSRRSARARTPERLLYKTRIYIYTYIAARLTNHYFVRNGGFSKMVAEDIFQTRLFCRSVEKLSTEIDSQMREKKERCDGMDLGFLYIQLLRFLRI